LVGQHVGLILSLQRAEENAVGIGGTDNVGKIVLNNVQSLLDGQSRFEGTDGGVAQSKRREKHAVNRHQDDSHDGDRQNQFD
jgi:hypothetical protein